MGIDKYKVDVEKVIKHNESDFRLIEDFQNAISDLYEKVIKSGFKLYRYMPVNNKNLMNILEQKIYLSDIGGMNDIYEGLFYDSDANYSNDELDSISSVCKIKSFSEINDSELMWAHYAESHRGICVEYDLKLLGKPEEGDEISVWKHLFPIVYSDGRNEVNSMKLLIEDIKELKKSILEGKMFDTNGSSIEVYASALTKSNCWQYEREWRLLYALWELYDVKKDKYNQGIDFPCISAIYMGHRIPEYDAEAIKLMADRFEAINHRELLLKKEIIGKSFKIDFQNYGESENGNL